MQTETRDMVPNDQCCKTVLDVDDDHTLSTAKKLSVIGEPTMGGQSPEVFITKDNIINTQDNVDLDIEKMISKDNVMEEAAQGTSVQVAKARMEANHYPERRRSERLKKDTCLTTMEKLERARTKRNLEGNSSKSNSFVVLSMDEMILVTSDMGVIMENDDFDTFNC